MCEPHIQQEVQLPQKSPWSLRTPLHHLANTYSTWPVKYQNLSYYLIKNRSTDVIKNKSQVLGQVALQSIKTAAEVCMLLNTERTSYSHTAAADRYTNLLFWQTFYFFFNLVVHLVKMSKAKKIKQWMLGKKKVEEKQKNPKTSIYPSNLHQIGYHDDAGRLFLPHHPPEVVHSLVNGTCTNTHKGTDSVLHMK